MPINLNTSAINGLRVGSTTASKAYLGTAQIFPSMWIQLGVDIDGEAAGDKSGTSVSLNDAGNVLAIGAIENVAGVSPFSYRGHVRVYYWNGTSWIQRGNDIDGEANSDYSGNSVSLNSTGDVLAIGAEMNDGNGSDSGHVRVYLWNGTSWIQRGADINGEAADDRSGISVSLNDAGDVLAIGATQNDAGGNNKGHVRVYVWNGTSWIQRGNDIDGEGDLDNSGNSVSLNSTGDVLAIGAPFNNGSGTFSGHARIYYWDGTSWIQRGGDIDAEAVGDQNGWSLSLNSVGDIVAIGARFNDGNGNNSGSTRVYTWDGTNWIQRGGDIDGEAAFDRSSYSVSLNSVGDIVAIGSVENDGNGSNSGSVRVYFWNGSSWIQRGVDLDGEATGNNSGWSVSLNSVGNIVAIGAPRNGGNGTNSGHVRTYIY